MKISILIAVFVLSFLSVKAQESKNKLKLLSINSGFGMFILNKNNYKAGDGLTLLANATFSISKNLISTSYLTGKELTILGPPQYHFDELSLLYGRELKIANWFRLEGFTGIGYYNQKSTIIEVADGNGVSFPFRLNTKFFFTKKFGIGFCTNYSINHVNNNFSENLIFHYSFN